ncbi:unnamed protein product [Ilex paraguariensis]|uniref:Uncharacterized protein n=1 Tax=Ilex paraguariensis TaxID=185542 RepID=A0ABC8SWN8_9AQUA
MCSFIEQVGTGEIIRLYIEDHQRISNMAEELSNDGLRVLGVAFKRLETQTGVGRVAYDDSIEFDMVFLGIISFFDPPKDSAKQALWWLAEKGVKAKTTHVITGADLELLNHESFHETIKRATVLARLNPTNKLRVVQSLQTVGRHVVGFLGNGVNDSLALDAANVGISVDSGASIAKEKADIVLLEKDLNVLVAGVEQGRLTFGNTMKYIKMSVNANLGSILSLLIATLCYRLEPLTPKQLLMQSFCTMWVRLQSLGTKWKRITLRLHKHGPSEA